MLIENASDVDVENAFDNAEDVGTSAEDWEPDYTSSSDALELEARIWRIGEGEPVHEQTMATLEAQHAELEECMTNTPGKGGEGFPDEGMFEMMFRIDSDGIVESGGPVGGPFRQPVEKCMEDALDGLQLRNPTDKDTHLKADYRYRLRE